MIRQWRCYARCSIADFNVAIRLDPKFAFAYNNRGFSYARKGDLDRAISDFGEAIRLDPRYVLAYINRGGTWYDKGDYYRAIADFDQALQLNPALTVVRQARDRAQATLAARSRRQP